MVKSLFTALLGFSLIFGFSGCGSNDSKSSSGDATGNGVSTGLSEAGQNLPAEFPAGKYGEINVTSDYKIPKEALFLDVRNPSERYKEAVYAGKHAEGSIDGAIYEIRPGDTINPDFVNDVLSLPEVNGDRSRYIILICNSSSRTQRAAEWLSTPQDQKWRNYDGGGFTRVYHIKGGLNGGHGQDGWEAAGLEIVRAPAN
jgi:rhodanese-related sulfurtransferase